MFWKKEVVYTDRLSEYRKAKIWDFNLFDDVIVTELRYPGLYREQMWMRWIICWAYYPNIDEDNQFNIYYICDTQWVLTIIEWKIKKCYWEFQEEFEALEETERLSMEVHERLKKLEELKKKTDKIKDINFEKLWLSSTN